MIGRKSILVLFSNLVAQICNGIVYFFAVNKFLPLQFGYYQVASSIIAVFILFSTLGFAETHVKIIAENKNLNEVFTIYFIIKIVLIVFSTFITVCLVFFQLKNSLITNEEEQLWIIIIVGINNLFVALSSIYGLSFRGTLEFAKLEFPIIIGAFISVFFSLISILIFENFLLYLCSNILSNSIILILYINFGKNFHFTHIKFNYLKRYLFLSIPFLIPILLLSLRRTLGPLLFLQYFDEELLGVYFVITSFFSMLILLERSFTFILIPNFTRLISTQNLQKLKDSVYIFTKYMAVINGITIIAGILFGEFFLKHILGAFYLEKGLFFFYAYLLTLLNFPLIGPFFSLLIVTEKMKVFLALQILPFVFSMISWIFFLPIFDILGIELGGWIALIPNIIIARLYCGKYFKVYKLRKLEFWHLFVLFGLIIISFIVASQQIPLIFVVLIFFVISGCYLVFLFSAKIMLKKDIKYILDNINPKKMINYIQEEVSNNEN